MDKIVIPKGLESLKKSILIDANKGEGCFNENGCDHEFYKMVPEENIKLVEMGFETSCRRVSKCSHKYCDKYKWIVDRAKLYAMKSGKTTEEVLTIWENKRSYWYMNFYQEGNQPIDGKVPYKSTGLEELNKELKVLYMKINGYKETIETLTSNNQIEIKKDLEKKLEKCELELIGKESIHSFIELNHLVKNYKEKE